MGANGGHILLIDDDLDLHEVVRLILAPDYEVTAHPTAAAGLAALAADPPDLLILDVMLSTPTEGLELALLLRGRPETSALPILLISAAPREKDLDPDGSGGLCGADLFLEKPLQARTLRAAVASLLGHAPSGGTP